MSVRCVEFQGRPRWRGWAKRRGVEDRQSIILTASFDRSQPVACTSAGHRSNAGNSWTDCLHLGCICSSFAGLIDALALCMHARACRCLLTSELSHRRCCKGAEAALPDSAAQPKRIDVGYYGTTAPVWAPPPTTGAVEWLRDCCLSVQRCHSCEYIASGSLPQLLLLACGSCILRRATAADT